MIKEYSELSFAIDLVSDCYNTTNPIIIAEKLEQDLDIHLTIYQIIDYYELMKIEVNHEEYYIKHY